MVYRSPEKPIFWVLLLGAITLGFSPVCPAFAEPIISSERSYCATLFNKAIGEDEFGQALKDEISKGSLFDIVPLSPSDAEQWNAKLLSFARGLPFDGKTTRKTSLTRREAQGLVLRIRTNPVSASWSSSKYDPRRNIGFCFGRAMAAHIESLTMGLDKDSILKLFAVGKMITGTTRWRYHVTTIVRAPDGDWWAIDPGYGAISITEWTRKMKEYDEDGTLRFFLTEAKRFGPIGLDPYRRSQLGSPGYNGYFNDLLWHFRNEAKKR